MPLLPARAMPCCDSGGCAARGGSRECPSPPPPPRPPPRAPHGGPHHPPVPPPPPLGGTPRGALPLPLGPGPPRVGAPLAPRAGIDARERIPGDRHREQVMRGADARAAIVD